MRPEYEKRDRARKQLCGGNENTLTTTVRLQVSIQERLRLFAKAEGGGVADMHREGLLRVIDNRYGDREYMEQLPDDIKQGLAELAMKDQAHLASASEASIEFGPPPDVPPHR